MRGVWGVFIERVWGAARPTLKTLKSAASNDGEDGLFGQDLSPYAGDTYSLPQWSVNPPYRLAVTELPFFGGCPSQLFIIIIIIGRVVFCFVLVGSAVTCSNRHQIYRTFNALQPSIVGAGVCCCLFFSVFLPVLANRANSVWGVNSGLRWEQTKDKRL